MNPSAAMPSPRLFADPPRGLLTRPVITIPSGLDAPAPIPAPVIPSAPETSGVEAVTVRTVFADGTADDDVRDLGRTLARAILGIDGPRPGLARVALVVGLGVAEAWLVERSLDALGVQAGLARAVGHVAVAIVTAGLIVAVVDRPKAKA